MWTKANTVLYRVPSTSLDAKNDIKIAAFDLTKTLIEPLSGKRHISDISDFSWTFPDVIGVMREFKKRGWCVVIFSNHLKHIGDRDEPILMERMEYIVSLFGFDPYIFLSLKADEYAKPHPFMFKLFLDVSGIETYQNISFFAGDKAGEDEKDERYREEDTDIKFADAIGLRFFTPAQVFEFPS